jgi:hypothetical protein
VDFHITRSSGIANPYPGITKIGARMGVVDAGGVNMNNFTANSFQVGIVK